MVEDIGVELVIDELRNGRTPGWDGLPTKTFNRVEMDSVG